MMIGPEPMSRILWMSSRRGTLAVSFWLISFRPIVNLVLCLSRKLGSRLRDNLAMVARFYAMDPKIKL